MPFSSGNVYSYVCIIIGEEDLFSTLRIAVDNLFYAYGFYITLLVFVVVYAALAVFVAVVNAICTRQRKYQSCRQNSWKSNPILAWAWHARMLAL